jgi:hypothetical protein
MWYFLTRKEEILMEILTPTQKSFVLPATDRFDMPTWLDLVNVGKADIPIRSLVGYVGQIWAKLEEEAAPSITVQEYKGKDVSLYRHLIQELGHESKVHLTFAQVLAFLKLDHHVPTEFYHQFQFFVGNDSTHRRPMWDLRAGLKEFGNGSKGWTMEVSTLTEAQGRYLVPRIIIPA